MGVWNVDGINGTRVDTAALWSPMKTVPSQASFEVAIATITQLDKASQRTAIGERGCNSSFVGSAWKTAWRRGMGRIDRLKTQP